MILYYILTTVFIITCVFLILVILLQSGKGGDVAAAFGGSGSQTAFGPRGAQKPLEKATVISAVLFMLLALLFSLPGLSGQSSVVKDGGGAAALPSPSPAASQAPATTASPVASPAVTASPVASASPAASPSPAAKPDKKK